MADIKEAAKWVEESKVIARASDSTFRWRRCPTADFWEMSMNHSAWGTSLALTSEEILADDWEVVEEGQ